MAKKNAAAQALGKLGGTARGKALLKAELSEIGKEGVKARMAKLTATERSAIAKKAVQVALQNKSNGQRKEENDETTEGQLVCVYQRGEVWWLKYSRYGKPYRESAQTTDKEKAKKKLKIRLAEIISGTFVGPQAERVRIQELADDFLLEYRINGTEIN